ncbi:F-type H+-transporting ATPase subunit b [Tistlia consotensis]|uniref:ATP synthase subunit b n=1 Tax=Tistlia consotensis USBA 355 TaxID=560819 RepID=A0A1Y6CME1_9PROT|nr:hypothetical protein [Tistlia consotensis]SMF62549.1 F-type H+-transporting ATPase subunit b [Tistlia consotensis USBA 355]SNR94889.1 F-type H+-transporting ATPase subunit b [Tistlia consotensis]
MRRIPSPFPTTPLQKAAAVLTVAGGLLSALPSLAQEAGEAAHKGLPQISQTDTFPSQVFWAIVTFALLYVMVARVILPRIAGTMEERQDKIDDDLSRAEKLKGEADQVMADYERGLQTARSEALDLLRKAQEAWQVEADKRNAAEDAKLAERIKADEDRIAKARAEAEGNLKSVAASVAVALTDKLIGVTPPDQQVSKAVDAVVQR